MTLPPFAAVNGERPITLRRQALQQAQHRGTTPDAGSIMIRVVQDPPPTPIQPSIHCRQLAQGPTSSAAPDVVHQPSALPPGGLRGHPEAQWVQGGRLW